MKNKNIEKYKKNDIEPTKTDPVFLPAVDIFENDTALLVRCDMPGTEENNIDVTLENNELTISGTQTTDELKDYKLLSGEYSSGTFKRTFKIPQEIEQKNIKAGLSNGVLEIELPKAEHEKPRKITINTGD